MTATAPVSEQEQVTPHDTALRPPERRSSRAKLVVAWDQAQTLREWSQDPRCQVNYVALKSRISYGWPAELAISAPLQRHRGGGPKAGTAQVAGEAGVRVEPNLALSQVLCFSGLDPHHGPIVEVRYLTGSKEVAPGVTLDTARVDKEMHGTAGTGGWADHDEKLDHLTRLAAARALDALTFGFDVGTRVAADAPLLGQVFLHVFGGQTDGLESLIQAWEAQEAVRSTWPGSREA